MQWIYQEVQGHSKSELFTLPTSTERTLFFDFLPMEVGVVKGYKLRLHLYTVPGQIVYEASRRLILKGLDGLVFVADSQPERMEENLSSLQGLYKNLKQQGVDIKKIPTVIQYNKRDLPNALDLEDMKLKLNPNGFPEFESQAHLGLGVFETLKTVSKGIIASLKSGRV
jgi:mutual gliding-motility protein MglA